MDHSSQQLHDPIHFQDLTPYQPSKTLHAPQHFLDFTPDPLSQLSHDPVHFQDSIPHQRTAAGDPIVLDRSGRSGVARASPISNQVVKLVGSTTQTGDIVGQRLGVEETRGGACWAEEEEHVW
ncbi:hypothetical protein LWI29_021591 [Acer saccharum]|uniref:Uncharacterized protein n=1 Tax=Acer saccharum TaxID=4024 RepID=A0AA39S2P0_ACESA|nr:hypothetical protein LWI29_021591 [Acer saccharum]